MSTDIWAEIKAIWRAIDILKSFDVPDISIITGWQKDIDSWTYASSTTLTITGDVTARFPVGTKIKLTQTTIKYFYVVSATYGAPTTTLTLTGGSDYSLANAAITLPYYSYQATPQLFPQWFTYTSTPIGSGGSAGAYAEDNVVSRFCVIGRECSVISTRRITNKGSWTGSLTQPKPIASANSGNASLGGEIIAQGTITIKAIPVGTNDAVFNWHSAFGTAGIDWTSMAVNDWIFIRMIYEI